MLGGMARAATALLCLLVATAGCDSRRVDPSDLEREVMSNARAKRALDILFVIDDSGDMLDEQQALAAAFPSLMTGLAELEGGLPSLHIGIATSDLGAGTGIVGCTGEGDDGALQNTPMIAGCTPPDDPWISDIEDPDCTESDPDLCRLRNFTGASTEEVFSCIAPLGMDGCGFEQTLESMKRALEGNPGFQREDASLAVVFLTSEDDCSVFDDEMFDTSQNSLSDPLGPLSSYRCFEFGVVCDPDAPRVAGAKTGCNSREDSPYVHPVLRYIDFLNALKQPPHQVIVAGLLGNPEPVAVTQDIDRMTLEPSCSSANGDGVPAVRLRQVLDATNGIFYSICNDDLSDAMQQLSSAISERLADALDGACLTGFPYDVDAQAAGIQPDCEVIEGSDFEEVASCEATSGARPCFEIVPSDNCASTQSGLALFVRRDEPPAPNTVVRASCRVRPDEAPTQSFYDCSAGGAGAWWLIGVAALVGLRRRRPQRRA
jgi:MYXO-CTERM domain-containing protein